MLCRWKIIVPKRLGSLGLEPCTTELAQRLEGKRLGPLTCGDKSLSLSYSCIDILGFMVLLSHFTVTLLCSVYFLFLHMV